MKKLLIAFLLTAVAPIFGQNYTFTAPHLTMHVGDPVPPCPIIVIDQTSGSSVGEGNNLFNGTTHDTCTTTATSSSPAGTYPVTLHAGNLTARSGGTITRVNSSINVIAADGNGARLRDSVPYPSGAFSGPLFPMLNVTSNVICNMVHDNGVTDNTACLQNLLTYGGVRSKSGAIVTTNGTTVTESTLLNPSLDFTTAPAGTSITINGASYTVASVQTTKSLTLTTSAGQQANVLMSVPTIVNTSGTMVTATNGISFMPSSGAITGNIIINNLVYAISSVVDSTHLITTTSLPTSTGVAFYLANYNSSGFNRSPIYLYFPTGIYWIHEQVQVYDDYWTLTGDGPSNSIIRLAPNSPQFNVGTTLVPMINVHSVGPNNNYNETIQNMQFRIGQGNPNAQAIHWINNNQGEISNVTLFSEDSMASSGVYLGQSGETAYAGATLLKDVAIYGFETGVAATSPNNEYSMTGDEITVEGQQAQAILANMAISLQHVLSDNSVPAYVSTATGRGALIDSEFIGENSSGTGITIASGNRLYYKNVSCVGYQTCESDDGTGSVVTHPSLPAEGWTGTAQTIFDTAAAAGSLAISDTETPIASDPAVSTWTMLGTDPSTWCTTIENSTSTTVYLPPGTYTEAGSPPANITCYVPDMVNHLIMWGAKFSVGSLAVQVTLDILGSSPTPLIIDGCMPGVCTVSHTGSRTVAILNTSAAYIPSAGAGNVYFEDVQTYSVVNNNAALGPTFYSSQLVTGRQLDIETGGSDGISDAKIQCQGASIFILGYKTEKNSPSIIETAGCKANLFGFYYYNTQTAPAGSAPMVLTDSSLFATGFNNWTAAGWGSPNWVNETRDGVTMSLAMPGSGLSYGEAMNMFYSYGANPPH